MSLSPEVSSVLLDLGVGGRIVAADPASHPDLAIGLDDEVSHPVAERLRSRGVQVVVLAPRAANEVDAAVQRIGRLVDRELRGRALAAERVREVSQIATSRDGGTRLRVAFVLACTPLTVVGGAGLVHETLELAGAENVFHEAGRERRAIRPDELATRAPQVVLDASASACVDPGAAGAWGARVDRVPPRLAAAMGLDLVERVRELHAVLYPAAR